MVSQRSFKGDRESIPRWAQVGAWRSVDRDNCDCQHRHPDRHITRDATRSDIQRHSDEAPSEFENAGFLCVAVDKDTEYR